MLRTGPSRQFACVIVIINNNQSASKGKMGIKMSTSNVKNYTRLPYKTTAEREPMQFRVG